MDDKKFDEIMVKYVSLHTNGKEHDFRKRKKNESSDRGRLHLPQYFYASAVVFIIIVVSAAIFLPLYLGRNKDGNEGDAPPPVAEEIMYFNDTNVIRTVLSSIDDVVISGYDVKLYDKEHMSVICNEITIKDAPTTTIGFECRYVVFGEVIDTINWTIFVENYSLSAYSVYEELDKSIDVGGVSITYSEAIEEECYKYRILVPGDVLRYCIEIVAISEVNIEDIIAPLL